MQYSESFPRALRPSLAGEGGVDCMDAGGRAMQEQLPRGETKNISFSTFFLSWFLKTKKMSKKEFILTPPHPNPLQQERA